MKNEKGINGVDLTADAKKTMGAGVKMIMDELFKDGIPESGVIATGFDKDGNIVIKDAVTGVSKIKEFLKKTAEKDKEEKDTLADILHDIMGDTANDFIKKLLTTDGIRCGKHTKNGKILVELEGSDNEILVDNICAMFVEYVNDGLNALAAKRDCDCETCEDKEKCKGYEKKNPSKETSSDGVKDEL